MWVYLLIAALSLAYIWLKFNYVYWKRKGVKGPEPIFLFGNLFKSVTFQTNVNELYVNWYNKYNDTPIVGYYKLLKPALIVRDPELVKEVLIKSFSHFHTNEANISTIDEDNIMANNPFLLIGEKWKRGRAIFGNLFSANKVRAVFPSMLQVGKEWKDHVRSFGPDFEHDAKTICSKFTLETMLRCTFSVDGGSFTGNTEFIKFGKSMFNPDIITGIKLLSMMIIPSLGKIFKLRLIPEHLENWYIQFVKTQIAARDTGGIKSDDVLQTILSIREKYSLTDTDIVGITVSFLIEAYETSANTLMVGLYQLATYPEIQEKLALEIQDAIDKNNGEITYDIIQKHEYLDKVLDEILRSKAIFFGMQKLCTKEFTIPAMEGLPHPVTIEKGTSIMIPFSGFTQDPNIFPNPDEFDPERFSPEQKALRHKQAFLPFSDGPRMCIGMHLGHFNLKLGIFQILRNFKIRFGPSQKPFTVSPLSIFNIPKDGIKLYLEPRPVK